MTYLKLNWNLPGANELNIVHCYFLKTLMIGVYDYLLPSTKTRKKGGFPTVSIDDYLSI